MKNNTFLVALKMLFGIDIILGVIAVSALGTFILWFLNGGVILLPIFISLPIYVLIFIIAFFVFGIKFGYKAVWIIMLSFPLGWLGYSHIYKITCGPNAQDVKVMKSMAKAISGYIIKYGIPKSLSDIPNMPYKLEGCKKKEGFSYSLFCIFNKDYSVEFADDPSHRYYSVNFYAPSSSTGMNIDFKVVNGNRLILEKSTPRLPNPHIYSNKDYGICRNPMKQ